MKHLKTYQLFEMEYDKHPEELALDWEYYQDFYLKNDFADTKGKYNPTLEQVEMVGLWNYEGAWSDGEKHFDPYKLVTPDLIKTSQDFIRKNHSKLYRVIWNVGQKDIYGEIIPGTIIDTPVEKIVADGIYRSNDSDGNTLESWTWTKQKALDFLGKDKGILLEVNSRDVMKNVFLVPNLVFANVSYETFQKLRTNYLLDYIDEHEVLLDGDVSTTKIEKLNW